VPISGVMADVGMRAPAKPAGGVMEAATRALTIRQVGSIAAKGSGEGAATIDHTSRQVGSRAAEDGTSSSEGVGAGAPFSRDSVLMQDPRGVRGNSGRGRMPAHLKSRSVNHQKGRH
jgi:hypothetical protein